MSISIYRCSFQLFLLLQLLGLYRAFRPRHERQGGRGAAATAIDRLKCLFSHQSSGDENVPQRYSLHYESRYEEINGEYFQSRLFISEPFVLDPSTFGIVNPFDDLVSATSNWNTALVPTPTDVDEGGSNDSFCGEECDECAIPDEFKLVDVNPIEVMAYLGLQRAKPLQSPKVYMTMADWE
jgi:hypothetical protein